MTSPEGSVSHRKSFLSSNLNTSPPSIWHSDSGTGSNGCDITSNLWHHDCPSAVPLRVCCSRRQNLMSASLHEQIIYELTGRNSHPFSQVSRSPTIPQRDTKNRFLLLGKSNAQDVHQKSMLTSKLKRPTGCWSTDYKWRSNKSFWKTGQPWDTWWHHNS